MAGRSKRRRRARALPGPLRCIAALEHRVSDRGTAGDSRAQRGIFRLRPGFALAAFPVARSGRQLATLAMKSAVVETESEMARRAATALADSSARCAAIARLKSGGKYRTVLAAVWPRRFSKRAHPPDWLFQRRRAASIL